MSEFIINYKNFIIYYSAFVGVFLNFNKWCTIRIPQMNIFTLLLIGLARLATTSLQIDGQSSFLPRGVEIFFLWTTYGRLLDPIIASLTTTVPLLVLQNKKAKIAHILIAGIHTFNPNFIRKYVISFAISPLYSSKRNLQQAIEALSFRKIPAFNRSTSSLFPNFSVLNVLRGRLVSATQEAKYLAK